MTPYISNSRPAEIAALNDAFRSAGPLFSRISFDGQWLITSGVQAMGPQFTWQAIAGTQVYRMFTPDNDPHGEHDFGSFEIDGSRVFWKIDYLQRGTPWGADDPADNENTCRVLTIMLAEEY